MPYPDRLTQNIKTTNARIIDLLDKKLEKYSSGDVLYEEMPVGIKEFIESPDFLDWDTIIFPGIKKLLIDFFQFGPDGWLKYDEAVVIAGLGSGKSEFAAIATTYIVYRLLCFRSPQSYFRDTLNLGSVSPESTLQIVGCAPSGDQARKIIFGFISNHVASCPWFQKRNWMPDKDVKSELRFPKNIVVSPGSSSAKPVLGGTLIMTLFDEASFFEKTSEHDDMEDLYKQLGGRMRSRFKNDLTGRNYSVSILISSANTMDDYIEDRFNENKKRDSGFAERLTFWEAKSQMFQGCDFFDYSVTDVAGNLLEILKVPTVYKKNIEENPVAFLRDIAGRPSAARKPLFSDFTKVLDSISTDIVNPAPEIGWEDGGYKSPSPFTPMDLLQVLEKANFRERNAQGKKYVVGIDLAKGAKDRLGFALAHVDKIMTDLRFIDGKPVSVNLPIAQLDLISRFVAPAGAEISFEDVRKLINTLRDEWRFDITLIASDSFQSIDFKQIMMNNGYDFIVHSTDTDRAPYETFWELVTNKRLIWYRFEPLLYELQRIEDLGGRFEHSVSAGKDCVDAATLSLYFVSGKDVIHRKVDSAIRKRAIGGIIGQGVAGGGMSSPGSFINPGSLIGR